MRYMRLSPGAKEAAIRLRDAPDVDESGITEAQGGVSPLKPEPQSGDAK
jgi:hypothetical protein